MDLVIPTLILGLATSIFTELLKLFPVFASNDNRKKILALVVSVLVAAYYIGTSPTEFTGGGMFLLFLGVLTASYVIYKSLVQLIVVDVVNPIMNRIFGRAIFPV